MTKFVYSSTFLPLVLLSFAAGDVAQAQTADFAVYQGVMLPGNEVPANTTNSVGYATMRAHAVRDSSGAIVSGSVQFIVDYNLPAATNIVGLHIHRGAAGVNGPVLISTGLSGSNSIAGGTSGRIDRTAEVAATDAPGVAALSDLFADPSQFYVNLHTTEYGGGIFRSQLTKASLVTTGGMMSATNEVPANSSGATGLSVVTAAVTRDSSGTIVNGMVTFDLKYSLQNAETFVGYHIHTGAAGTNGPIRIGTPITAGTPVPSDPNGTGTLHYDVLANASDPAVRDVLENLFNNPGSLYINIHTSTFAGGIMRSQLRSMDSISIPATMLPSNETPAITGLNAAGAALLTVNTLRGDDGTVIAGGVTFDVNYRFPGATTFTGLHIHNGAATVAGPVTINTGLAPTVTVDTDTGSGNIYRTAIVSDPAGLATLNSIVTTPDQQYVNLHTTVYPGGAVRSQLAVPLTTAPTVNAIISAVSDPTNYVLPRGGLVSIYGTNMTRLVDSLAAFTGSKIPTTYDGVQVTVGGFAAPLIYLSPGLINAQVPFEAPLGSQPVIVTNNGQKSTAFSGTVTAAAPGIFFDATGGIVLKVSDYSLIRPANPAVRGKDVLLIYCTGLGTTNPGVMTGQTAAYPPLSNVSGVNVTLGGEPLSVYYAAASPGFIGLYQVATNLPMAVPTGTQTLQVSVNGIASNGVKLAIQ